MLASIRALVAAQLISAAIAYCIKALETSIKLLILVVLASIRALVAAQLKSASIEPHSNILPDDGNFNTYPAAAAVVLLGNVYSFAIFNVVVVIPCADISILDSHISPLW